MAQQEQVQYPEEKSFKEFIKRSKYIVDKQAPLSKDDAMAKIVTPFLSALGWNVYDKNVEFGYTVVMGVSTQKVDCVLKENRRVKVCIEACSMQEEIGESKPQLASYMRQTGADLGLLSNGEEYRLYSSDSRGSPREKLILNEELEGLWSKKRILEQIARDELTELYEDGELSVEITYPAFDGIKDIIRHISDSHKEDWAPREDVLDVAETDGMEPSAVQKELNKLKTSGQIYEPRNEKFRVSG